MASHLDPFWYDFAEVTISHKQPPSLDIFDGRLREVRLHLQTYIFTFFTNHSTLYLLALIVLPDSHSSLLDVSFFLLQLLSWLILTLFERQGRLL